MYFRSHFPHHLNHTKVVVTTLMASAGDAATVGSARKFGIRGISVLKDLVLIRDRFAVCGRDIGTLPLRTGEISYGHRNRPSRSADLALVAARDGCFKGSLGNVVLVLRCDEVLTYLE